MCVLNDGKKGEQRFFYQVLRYYRCLEKIQFFFQRGVFGEEIIFGQEEKVEENIQEIGCVRDYRGDRWKSGEGLELGLGLGVCRVVREKGFCSDRWGGR